MPAGISDPIAGYLAFGFVKFAGYSLAEELIARSYDREDSNPFLVGGTRTLLGMAVGAPVPDVADCRCQHGIGCTRTRRIHPRQPAEPLRLHGRGRQQQRAQDA